MQSVHDSCGLLRILGLGHVEDRPVPARADGRGVAAPSRLRRCLARPRMARRCAAELRARGEECSRGGSVGLAAAPVTPFHAILQVFRPLTSVVHIQQTVGHAAEQCCGGFDRVGVIMLQLAKLFSALAKAHSHLDSEVNWSSSLYCRRRRSCAGRCG